MSLLGKLIALAALSGLPCACKTVDYVRDVRPILAEKCFVYPGAAQYLAGLRLDRKEQWQSLLAAGEKSEFLLRITSTDASFRMPPWPTAIYKSYPVYAPGRVPAGYLEKLKGPALGSAFDTATLKKDGLRRPYCDLFVENVARLMAM